jgi:hypothetical protein
MELRNPQEGEIGLFLLLLKDVLSGDLPVGGTASVGRGVLTGQATLHFPDGFVAKIKDSAASPEDTVKRIDKEIELFHNTQSRNRTQEAAHG